MKRTTSQQLAKTGSPTTLDVRHGRDLAGRFLPGHPGSGGRPRNPHGRKVAELRAAVAEAISVDDVRRVVHMLVQMATSGNVKAIHLLLSLLGPMAPVNPDRV